MPTTQDFASIAAKIKTTLDKLEARYPDSAALALLHRQLNTLAIMTEQHLALDAGALGGVTGGEFHTESGGTPKGGNH